MNISKEFVRDAYNTTSLLPEMWKISLYCEQALEIFRFHVRVNENLSLIMDHFSFFTKRHFINYKVTLIELLNCQYRKMYRRKSRNCSMSIL